VPVKDFYAQLKDRRVIRTAIIYVALLWAILQVADLLADAGIVSGSLVRWIILLGVVGFPLTLLGSWFLESPWKKRRWTSNAGDLLLIVAIAVAAILFARQQWFQSTTRPSIAFLKIEATDTREDTQDVANHLAARFRLAMATLPEVRVIELSSSQHDALASMPIPEKAAWLDADYLVGGTLSQSDSTIRLGLQLFAADGGLIWGERYEDRLIDQVQIQNRVLADIWPSLALAEPSLAHAQATLASCDYPEQSAAVLAVMRASSIQTGAPVLEEFIAKTTDNGLLHLARARQLFHEIESAAPPRRPVIHRLAMQHLDFADDKCPGFPPIELSRLTNTLVLTGSADTTSGYANRHPNSALVFLGMAREYQETGDVGASLALIKMAFELDPANDDILCTYRDMLGVHEDDGQEEILQTLGRNIVLFAPNSCETEPTLSD